MLEDSSTFKTIIYSVIDILKLVVPILFGLALVFFFWGLTKYILRYSSSPKELEEGKKYMLWSILALFVLFTFRAIIGLITNEFEFGRAGQVPLLPTGGQTDTNSVIREYYYEPGL